MLKQIPKIITPDLMKIMMEMGHADIMIFADANYPAYSNAKKLIRLPGVEITELLEAVLPYFPLDCFVANPVRLMRNLDSEPIPEIWDTYKEIIRKYDEEKAFADFSLIDRLPFYEESQKASVIVQTTTTERYANIALQKGVI
ncbi:MAG: RbsD/FucU domain-containing protein [Lachnospiraceae bacterium]